MKFVTKYAVDDLPRTGENGEITWEDRNRVKRSVNGFIMETYCELLGRRCTREDMQRHLDWWPDPQRSQELGGGSAVVGDVQITAGMQKRLDLLHKASMTPGGLMLPENGEPVDDMPMSGDIPDPDFYRRFELRKSIMLSDEYLRENLKRMIDNVLHRDGLPIIPSEYDVRRFLKRYKTAMFADLAPLFGGDPDTGEPIKLNGERNHRAEFGRQLYAELCDLYLDGVDPIGFNLFAYDQRLVFSYYYCWHPYIQLPAPGPFDVWAPHAHLKPRDVDWDTYKGADAWGPIPGSVHGIWSMDDDRGMQFYEQDFSDAVAAGIDVLIFMTWIRPGATVYPWLPQGNCKDWWNCCGGDDMGLRWLQLAVRTLNKMRREGKPTPKIALGIETPQIGPVLLARKDHRLKRNMDPVHWAACARSFDTDYDYTAEWGEDRDPGHSLHERNNFFWPFKFPEAQRYLASMLRTIFQEVPLEHLAFMEGRPMFYIWQVTDNMECAQDPSSAPAKTVSTLFSEEFYGLHLWAIADFTWGRSVGTPYENDFIYDEGIDARSRDVNLIRVGDACKYGTNASYMPARDVRTMIALGPGTDGTAKSWRPATEPEWVDQSIATRNYGNRYFENWVKAVIGGLRLRVGEPGSIIRDSASIYGNDDVAPRPELPPFPESPVRLVIETWNELYEGTGVCRSREYSDAYLTMTRVFTSIWRSGSYSDALDWLVARSCEAFTGWPNWPGGPSDYSKLFVRETDESLESFWVGIGRVVSTFHASMQRHPPLVSVVGASSAQVELAELDDENRPPCARGATWFLPVTIYCKGTGKREGNAYLWVKFYPQTAEGRGWKVFTNPDPKRTEERGVEAWCRLIEIHRSPIDEGMSFGCIIQGTSEDVNAPYMLDDRMRRPWDEMLLRRRLFEFPMPAYGVTYIMVVNVVVDGFTNQSAVLQLGGSYKESGDMDGTASWVHLERSLHEVDLTQPSIVRRPMRIDPKKLPDPIALMPSGRIGVISGAKIFK